MSPAPPLLQATGAPPTGKIRRVVPTSRLYRLLLGLAHLAWIAVVLIDVATFMSGVLLFDRVMHTPCPSRTVSASVCATGQFTPDTMRRLPHLGLSLDLYAAITLVLLVAVSAVLLVTGALIAWRKWREGMGLLASVILITLGAHGSVAAFQSVDSQLLPTVMPPLAGILGVAGGAIFVLQWPALGAFLLTFPTGRFTPGWTWVLVGLWITNFFAFWLGPPLVFTMLSVIVTYGSVTAVQVYRYRRVYGPVERRQTKWLVYLLAVGVGLDLAYTAALALMPGSNSTHSGLSPVVFTALGAVEGAAVFLLIGLAVAIALLRYRLYDIDLIINRTLVYGGLTVLVIGGYVLIVGYLGALFRAHGSLLFSLLATGIVAVLFQPARQWLQQGVNRLLYGDRDDPYAVIARLGRQLEGALTPEAILPTVATTIREALRLPYAAIVLPRDEGTAAAVGEPREGIVRLPLVHAGEPVGELLLSPRAPGEMWTAAERRLLDDLAHSAGGAVQAVRLTRELQRSRERLVLAREEERRRLRRDLHDELAPSLAALALTASAAIEFIPPEAIRPRRLLEELRQALRESVGAIRRIAYDLRPPTLDELGLIAAIRERAEQYTAGDETGGHSGPPLRVTVDSPDYLPPLSAAAEVAAYCIVQEALMNVVRHAQARHCLIRLAVARIGTTIDLEVTITDDGVGLPEFGVGADYRLGVGLRSMQERVTELGGTFRVEQPAMDGARIRVCLPANDAKRQVVSGIPVPLES